MFILVDIESRIAPTEYKRLRVQELKLWAFAPWSSVGDHLILSYGRALDILDVLGIRRRVSEQAPRLLDNGHPGPV